MKVSIAHHTYDTTVELTVSECITILNGDEVLSGEGEVVIYDEFADADESGPEGSEIRTSTAHFNVKLINPNVKKGDVSEVHHDQ